MELIIHRDTEKIGGSTVEFRSKSGSRMIIDIGIPLFGEDGGRFNFKKYSHLSGTELVERGILPKVEQLYSRANEGNEIAGVLISHAHQDHYGFFNYVHDSISFYLGEATKELIDLTTTFTPLEGTIENYNFFSSGNKFSCGDFEVTPYLMDHSAFDAYAFLIKADGKRVIYSGDFRAHGRKKKVLDYFLNDIGQGVDAILLEGTNLGTEQKDIKSEERIEAEITELAKEERPLLLYSSSQNIDRLVSFYKAAKRTGRILLIDIYTAHLLDRLKDFARLPHLSVDFPELKVFYPYYLTKRSFKEGNQELMYKFSSYKLSRKDIVEKRNKIMMLVRSSMLSDLRVIDQLEGSNNLKKANFVYSMWDGYLEEDSMLEMSDFIAEREIKFHIIHTSGHASGATLQRVVDKLQPKEVVPIHTMNFESYHRLGAEVTKLENGESYKI
ncbi:MBL fold metallo-hydrolase [Natroniella sulfidigena]|uniref:MBL fold metallo-hydrolase n=1 Tax=Natroniella sulfidigena TaxID=723921 RepID=UPI00200ACC40|nr:MBL fold metallo-hydrolase [Natroniella sulfidigena]MCK8818143.1 MBL fold metallo-hydrolase [Natroniella sulfidigena]